ncbi:MAG: signal peptide peptidase SppA [Candidatus Sericytochromatia bacterium]|nr:signal peptide peptidase SppA [Candidatus Sericytochromatia bacterium]
MKTDRIIAGTLVALCFASVITGFIFQKNSNPTNAKSNSFSWSDSSFGIKKADIAVIDISGPIMYSESNGFGSSGVNANDIIPMLEQIKKDKIKGIFLRINSPGGTASASQAIYEKIMFLKKNSNIKVVSFMEDIAASGAYYIASASDVIYANPSTLTGSIGVIMQIPNYTDLQNKIGYQTNTIKSGKFKDIGNSSRKMTDDERTLLQNLINDTYNEFAKAVSKGRKLSIEKVKQLGDGRIYTGNQANDNKLIDKLGSESDAINELARELKIDGEPKLKNYSKASWEKLFGGLSSKSVITGTVFDSPEFSASFNKIPLTLYK